MLSGKQEGFTLKLNTTHFLRGSPRGTNLAIRTPITEVSGEFWDIEQAIAAAATTADSFPAATWIVIEDDQNVEHARLYLALLWQIFEELAFLGFPGRVLRDSWEVGIWRADLWIWIGKSTWSVGRRSCRL